jgi:hypothetical protein
MSHISVRWSTCALSVGADWQKAGRDCRTTFVGLHRATRKTPAPVLGSLPVVVSGS